MSHTRMTTLAFILSELLYPRFEKVGGILVYICPWFRPSSRPSFRNTFSSKISLQQFKIETSNLVYRFAMTCCIVGLKMGLLLFVLPCICSFFFLSRYFVKDISTTVKDRHLKFRIRFTTTSCIVGLKMGPLLFVLPYICSFFFLSRFFVKDISTTV